MSDRDVKLELLSFLDRCSDEVTAARNAVERGDVENACEKFGDLATMIRGKAIELRDTRRAA